MHLGVELEVQDMNELSAMLEAVEGALPSRAWHIKGWFLRRRHSAPKPFRFSSADDTWEAACPRIAIRTRQPLGFRSV